MIGAGVIFLLDMIYLHEKIFQSLTAGSGPAKLKKVFYSASLQALSSANALTSMGRVMG